MLEDTSVTFAMTQSAEEKLGERLRQITKFRAVPGLLLGRERGDDRERWMVGFYDEAVVLGSNFHAAKIYIGSGRYLVVPQLHLVSGLDGKELHWDGTTFLVRDMA